MTAAGLIFSNIHDDNLPELTRYRTMASVPFGCRYRLIDFALSNLVNSNITKVGIITHNNYQSLMDHIGNGKDWDLARRNGGIKFLPPFITAYDSTIKDKPDTTRLEALMGVTHFISRCTEDYMVLMDCDVLCNIDLSDVIAQHEKTGADITIVTTSLDFSRHELSSHVTIVTHDEDGRVQEMRDYSADMRGTHDVSTNIMIVKRMYLLNIIQESAVKGYHNFYRDIINRHHKKDNFRVYKFDGYYNVISSMTGYFHTSMDMIGEENRKALFSRPNAPIYTKVRNSAPTRYTASARVESSLVADGCVIEGTVENSIIFRGVHVGKGSVVRNSILMQDTYVGTSVHLGCVITDKNVIIKDGRNLSGHESMPFYIPKETML